MAALYNLVRMTTPTIGPGTITLGAALPSFLSFAQAGAQDGDTVGYAIDNGNNREIGRGVYNAAAQTLTRNVLNSTNNNNPINLNGNAQVSSAASAEDFLGGGVSVIVAATPPANPAPDTLWWDSSEGKLYLWFDDGDSQQWVGVASPGIMGPEGPQGILGPTGATGPEGPSGEVEEAPQDGLSYGRKDAGWSEIVGEIEEAPQDGQTFGRQDGGWASIPMVPTCGRFRALSATEVGFFPYQGDAVKIAGRIYKIPASGVIATNAGLTASTLYYVYIYVSGGNLALEFSAAPHETDASPGNVGVEIKQGDDSRTLVGMVRIWTNGHFADNTNLRLVASWFNRQSKTLHFSLGAGSVAGPGGQIWISGNSAVIWLVCWPDEVVNLLATGQAQCANAGDFCQAIIGVDSTGAPLGGMQFIYNQWHMSLTVGGFSNFAEGAHHFGVLFAAQGTTMANSWNWQMTGATRC